MDKLLEITSNEKLFFNSLKKYENQYEIKHFLKNSKEVFDLIKIHNKLDFFTVDNNNAITKVFIGYYHQYGGEINFFWIRPEDRLKGEGRKWLNRILSYFPKDICLELTSYYISSGFWKKMGFRIYYQSFGGNCEFMCKCNPDCVRHKY